MGFENMKDIGQLAINVGHCLFHRERLGIGPFACGLGQILWRANARDHILTLRID